MAQNHPKLRPIEAFPVRQGKEELICLRDPHGFTEQIITVSMSAAPVLQCFDGRHSLEEIQLKVARATAVLIPLEQLEKLVAHLDEALLLDSPRFAAFHDKLVRDFRHSPVREAALAGQSYPARAADIHRMFEKHFAPPQRPGGEGKGRTNRPAPVALVVPHIDLRHGGPTYAWAYAELLAAPPVDLFVILGVAHSPTGQRFVGTTKDFQTPLGTLATDTAFMDAVAEKLPFDLYADELAHRREHSVEFQVVYLQHVLGAKRKFQIAPILVGSFHDLMEAGREPRQDRQVAAFVKSLRAAIAGSGKRVCVIASVDLAHVGGRFGDEFSVNKEVLAQLAADDRAMLALVEACDPGELCRFIYGEQDRRRVDAWPAVYTMLQATDVTRGKLLHYAQSHERDTNSVVTFASVSLW